MVIYLVRHGETDWNRQNRLQGIEDIELNETGLMQSAVCAKAFLNVPIDGILTSPLKRAKVTAEIVASIINAGPVIVEQGLTERDFGRLSGLTYEEREALLTRNEDPGMEPKQSLTDRFMTVLYQYIREPSLLKTSVKAYKNILVVSHRPNYNANHETPASLQICTRARW